MVLGKPQQGLQWFLQGLSQATSNVHLRRPWWLCSCNANLADLVQGMKAPFPVQIPDKPPAWILTVIAGFQGNGRTLKTGASMREVVLTGHHLHAVHHHLGAHLTPPWGLHQTARSSCNGSGCPPTQSRTQRLWHCCYPASVHTCLSTQPDSCLLRSSVPDFAVLHSMPANTQHVFIRATLHASLLAPVEGPDVASQILVPKEGRSKHYAETCSLLVQVHH